MTEPGSELPPSRNSGGPYRIGVVCLGNICRSPMAAVVLEDGLARAGLDVEVTSSGTGDWHVGEAMDRRAAATLVAAGYDPSSHRAQQITSAWFDASTASGEGRDLLLVMDRANRADVLALGAPAERVRMFRCFDPAGGPDEEVPDPWAGGQQGFDEVLAIVERTSAALVERLRSALD